MSTTLEHEAVAELHRRLNQLTPDAERRWGSMTPHGAVVHMTDAFKMAMGERPIRDKSTPFLRTVGRCVGFHTPLPWPKGFRAPYEIDQDRGGTSPEVWDRDLESLHAALDRFAADPDGLDGAVHAVFGPLSRKEWGVWGYRHTDHHLRQFGA